MAEATEVVPTKTYRHLISGSTYIFKNANIARFYGKTGMPGFYTTSDPQEQSELDYLAKHPQVQVELVDSVDDTAIHKIADPAIAKATGEVTESSIRSSSPEVISAADNLAKVIAANKGQA